MLFCYRNPTMLLLLENSRKERDLTRSPLPARCWGTPGNPAGMTSELHAKIKYFLGVQNNFPAVVNLFAAELFPGIRLESVTLLEAKNGVFQLSLCHGSLYLFYH